MLVEGEDAGDDVLCDRDGMRARGGRELDMARKLLAAEHVRMRRDRAVRARRDELDEPA